MKTTHYEAIVIGGSWGGMEALIQLVQGMPKLFPLPILVAIHRQRNVDSSLCEIIGGYSAMTVKEMDEKEVILPGVIYVAPANYHTLIEKDKTISFDIFQDKLYSSPSIDILFETAAQAYGNKLIGILLTGANADGSEGLKAISEKKGLTIVQDPGEAKVNTMPMAGLKAVKADHVLKINEIREFLLHLLWK